MSVKERLQDIFREIFEEEELQIFDTMTADDIEDWDSLMHMQLIMEIEKAFQIRFSTAEIKSAENVGQFITIIERKQKNEGGSKG